MNKESLIFSATNVMTCDVHWLKQKKRVIEKRLAQNLTCDDLILRFLQRLTDSQNRLAQRKLAIPDIEYPDNLPISDKAGEILSLIQNHQVCIIAGETGSGKTTQIPKICLQAGRGTAGLIGHTQPRRLAATTVAARIAEECKIQLGQQIGYQVRFNDKTADTTLIKLMTDGILLAEIQHDRYLTQYDTLIIDEAHERSLNIDFILGFIKQLLPKRPDLKVIITSATIDVDRFSNHFDQAPILEVSGRHYPVETRYLPPQDLNENGDGDLATTIVNALHEIIHMEQAGEAYRHGDVLVFLPGERDIRETSLALKKARFEHMEVLPLYARLSQSEQQRIFKKHAMRRIVLATNVAETSLTVPGIRYVIDTGLARISRYSSRSKVQRLPIEAISQASANQRLGRCGRTAPGICLRLYSQQDFDSRPEFMQAEILRTNLAAVILQMLQLGLGKVEDFPFIDKPETRNIKDGFHLLSEVGAIDNTLQLTRMGRQMSQLPIDPRLGRMVIAAEKLGCLTEVLIIVSGISSQDPRERPGDKQQQATQAHARFNESGSDFLSLLSLWHYFEELRLTLSQNQLRKRFKKEFLSYLRLREWRDIHHQLLLSVKSIKLVLNPKGASSDTIHRALLAGLLSHIGEKQERRLYLGARNRQFHLFPGSSLNKKPPQWLMSAELVETSKLYARVCGEIDPEWVLDYAGQLIKKNYSDPAFSTRTGHVMATCRISLYGLTIQDKKRVTYSQIDPELCHQLFIRQALVEGAYAKHKKSLPPFWLYNAKLIAEVNELEAKSRRCDILVDDDTLYQFFADKIPQEVNNIASFDKWRKLQEQSNEALLHFDKSLLMRHNASDINEGQFPEQLIINQHSVELNYHFEPEHQDDGVTAIIPLTLINQLPANYFEWLVPGLLTEKCIELLKSLPKNLRKQLVPIPNFVANMLNTRYDKKQSLYQFISQTIQQRKGILLSEQLLKDIVIDDYYLMNFHVIDAKKEVIAKGRQLESLLEQCKPHIKHVIDQVKPKKDERRYTLWEFGSITSRTLTKHDISMLVFPILNDHGDSVSLEMCDNEIEATLRNKLGIIRLLWLNLPKQIKYLKKELFHSNRSSLLLTRLGYGNDFIDALICQVLDVTFLSHGCPNDAKSFDRCIESHQGKLIANANNYEQLLLSVFDYKAQVDKQIKQHKLLTTLDSLKDIKLQLQGLFYDDTLNTPYHQLNHYPRYLKAILYRLEKMQYNPKELQGLAEMKTLQQRLLTAINDDFSNLANHPQYHHYRWLLEEYRVSLFAQHLGTAEKVSNKRLDKVWPR